MAKWRPLSRKTFTPVQVTIVIGGRLLGNGYWVCGRCDIRSVEIVLTGNANESKQRIASSVSQRRAHPMRCRRRTDGADGPVRGYPFPGGMREHRGEIDDAGRLVQRGRLNGC